MKYIHSSFASADSLRMMHMFRPGRELEHSSVAPVQLAGQHEEASVYELERSPKYE